MGLGQRGRRLIVVDSSAVVAILLGEKGSKAMALRLQRSPPGGRIISAANFIEAGTVLAGREEEVGAGVRALERFVADAGIEIVAVDADQARIALAARIRFGKGFGAKAGLNYGDCFAYALAKAKGAPLLFTGDDFHQTDIEAALSTRRG